MSTLIDDDAMIARRLALSGTYNVRDVGGYPTVDGRTVKWQTLFRGDALHQVDEEGRAAFTEIGLRTLVDLRDDDERAAAPDNLHPEVRVVHVPVFSKASPEAILEADEKVIDRSSPTLMADVYRMLVHAHGDKVVEAIRELARPGSLPAIVHCTAGKDRTGIVIALVLEVAGVPDEVIAIDFTATNLFLNEEFRSTVLRATGDVGRDEESVKRMLACPPELILDVLAGIREKHGSVEQYLIDHGMTIEEIAALRAELLVDAHTE